MSKAAKKPTAAPTAKKKAASSKPAAPAVLARNVPKQTGPKSA